LSDRIVLSGIVIAALVCGLGTAAPAEEFRGLWAEVWGVGFKTTADIDDLVSRAVQGRYNAILPQMLAYHDNRSNSHGAYWNSSIVPKAPDIQLGLDPLAYLCQKAHAQGLEVHPWLVPYRACSVWPPQGNTLLSNHPEYFLVPRASMGGGPIAFGSQNSYYLDPGSPDVQEYLISIVEELVTQYPIDGIHFDYLRYIQADAGYPADTSYYYSSLRRFWRITGRTDTPEATGDTAWDDFRRRTITEFVRRCRAEIPSLASDHQPVRLSAALITWGNAPSSFESTSAYQRFQNWEQWQRLGLIDTAIPMTYYAESSYPTWYRNWVNKEMAWRYDRQMVVGHAAYLNTLAQSETQMEYARTAGADGLTSYCYADTRSDAGDNWEWYPYVATNVFTVSAAVPTMPWRNPATATEGTLWGRVTDAATDLPIDNVTVQVGSLDAVQTDGSGYYVVTLIPATSSGTNYTVTADITGYPLGIHTDVTVVAGDVRLENFALGGPAGPPGDMDGDGDVDQEDFGLFQSCLTGPNVSQDDPTCHLAKLDEGDDVDGADMTLFRGCISGPGIPADPYCTD